MRKLVPAEFSPSKVEVLPNKKDRDIGVRELKQFVRVVTRIDQGI